MSGAGYCFRENILYDDGRLELALLAGIILVMKMILLLTWHCYWYSSFCLRNVCVQLAILLVKSLLVFGFGHLDDLLNFSLVIS
jgi:hypothetical protein